ncbi:Bifunctional inhibitor/lipid-transfer protein/seed storage 2S albumin superfamily protein [Salvia divinorum]|uniref:Bifunctional inhibitor/lipid-transfer protein/seed storage 2S albumin superfamily protein n=1 Tax=Salvia divinorum TaxID=28513 RepID=A0ABD1IGF5_SALDI
MKKGVAALFVVVVMALLVHETTAFTPPPPKVVCNPEALASCLGFIVYGSTLSQECCRNLKEQQPCYCQYYKDPILQQFIQSPNAEKLTRACNLTNPTTC